MSPEAAEALTALVLPHLDQQPVYLTGEGARATALRSALVKARADSGRVELIEVPLGSGRSAAIAGLERLSEQHGAGLPLTLRVKQPDTAERAPRQAAWNWVFLAGGLIVVSLLLRYGAPLAGKRSLERRVEQLRTQFEALPRVERDLAFLQYLETNQPPFLDALYQLAVSAPPGTRLESVAMSRRGDVALRGSVSASQQALDLRSNLVQSGLFTTVVLDEQTPTPDRQKVTFRVTAQLKPPADRPSLVVPPATSSQTMTQSSLKPSP
jgi:hypothetical protein